MDISHLFSIKYPIIQAGMVWCSGWKLAKAVSESGGLGLIGAGSMAPDVLEHHIKQFKQNCDKPFGVNLPLLYSHINDQINLILKYKVPIVFTSAGSPALHTKLLKDYGVKVVHVVSSVKFALKAQESGVDAIVAEGFEAGGHNGREETTTMCLIPSVVDAVSIPVIAAGGISCGRTMFAAIALGAKGVQIGSRFAISQESSAHELFKKAVINAQEGQTDLVLKKLNPVRVLKNHLYNEIKSAELNCASEEQLRFILGKGKSRLGIFEGDISNGELEIGQVSMRLNDIPLASGIVNQIWLEYNHLKSNHKAIFP